MKTTKIIPLFIAISISAQSALATSFIQGKLDTELQSPTPLTSAQLAQVQSVQFIFVDGIFGDVFKSNFHPAIEVLTGDWNVSDYAVFTPDTRNTMPDNADILYSEISKVRASSPHAEAVLTAHSKGATEVLLMLLRHPELVTKMGIKTVNLVSGPHEGTDIIRYFDQCSDLDFICHSLNGFMPSIESLMPSTIIPIEMAALNNLDAPTRQELAKHFFYVETLMANDDFASPLLIPHFYMNNIGEPDNDGLIPTISEVFTPNGQVFGNDLGVMPGNHNSLLSRAITPGNKTYRHAFFQVLIKNTFLK
jgi:hypothetical protein